MTVSVPEAPIPTLPAPAERLVDRAAARGRSSLRTRVWRLRAGAWPIAQAAIGAGAAWGLAIVALGHERPVFAALAAVISLGATVGQRTRRAFELVLGVLVGLLVADLIVLGIGSGPLQIALVVVLAMGATTFLGAGPLLVTEAAVSAVLVVTLEAGGSFPFTDRFLDALVGGAVGFAVNNLVFPPNPSLLVGRAAQAVFAELGTVIEDIATALEGGDLGRAEAALARARKLDERVDAFADALSVGRETARLAPPRRGARAELERYAEAAGELDLAVRDTRVMARAVQSLVRRGEPSPDSLIAATRQLAEAVWALGAQLEEPDRREATRTAALEAAASATRSLEERRDLPTSALISQIRSTAVDVLRASGMDRGEIIDAFEEPERSEPGARASAGHPVPPKPPVEAPGSAWRGGAG